MSEKKTLARKQEPVSLCAPEADLSCFGCCPPIRPHHYDALQYVGSLKREFAENRENFTKSGPSYRPIVGYSCWGLGYLDKNRSRIGCLLHPCRNEGRDLRHLIDYGNKCQRESCRPSRFFSLLPAEGQFFWLPLVRGMNPFYYSSPRANPLFHILLWGCNVLETMRKLAGRMDWTVTELLFHRPFLISPSWNPRIHSYLFRLVLGVLEETDGNTERTESLCRKLWPEVLAHSGFSPSDATRDTLVHTHKLDFDEDYLDLLRLGFGWSKTTRHHAQRVKEKIEALAVRATEL